MHWTIDNWHGCQLSNDRLTNTGHFFYGKDFSNDDKKAICFALMKTQTPLSDRHNTILLTDSWKKLEAALNYAHCVTDYFAHLLFCCKPGEINKILTHPWYPSSFDWFSWWWSKKSKMADSKKLSFLKLPILKFFCKGKNSLTSQKMYYLPGPLNFWQIRFYPPFTSGPLEFFSPSGIAASS